MGGRALWVVIGVLLNSIQVKFFALIQRKRRGWGCETLPHF